jgi:hypothetical protein
MDAVRGMGDFPFERGKVTYYKLFGDKWCCDRFDDPPRTLNIPLGNGEVTYQYDPNDPATFKGGLSTNFGGNAWQDSPNARPDIISLFTPEFSEDTFIKGQMNVRLQTRSNCEDTCFYVRISLCKPEGYYGLRDDIHQISNFQKIISLARALTWISPSTSTHLSYKRARSCALTSLPRPIRTMFATQITADYFPSKLPSALQITP